MRIHLASGQNMFRPQMQNPMRSAIGQAQSLNLQKVFKQASANYVSNKNRDMVELSKMAQSLLNDKKTKETALDTLDTKIDPDQMAIFGYQKYPSGISKEQWAEYSISEKRNEIKTVSDMIDYAKSKLQFTMSKIDELENYLNGTGTHSDPNMTKELAETYLYNYKQSIKSEYVGLSRMKSVGARSSVEDFDKLSGGQASQVMGDLFNSISSESLGLANLSDDPQKMMEAFENASKILEGMNKRVEEAYAQFTGGKRFTEPASSFYLFDGNAKHDFFVSQMERWYKIKYTERGDIVPDVEWIDTSQMKFTGKTLSL